MFISTNCSSAIPIPFELHMRNNDYDLGTAKTRCGRGWKAGAHGFTLTSTGWGRGPGQCTRAGQCYFAVDECFLHGRKDVGE